MNPGHYLQVDESYLNPLEAEWASVFLAPRWVPISRTDLQFRRAWARQISAIQQHMVHIQLRGHVLFDELEQLAADMTAEYGAEAMAVRQTLIDYALALLQADVAARAVQQDYGGSESEQAVRQYIRFLASARLTSQANETVGSLLEWVFEHNNGLSEDESALIETRYLTVLAAHADLLDASRGMIESYAKLKLTDEILGSLLDGAILAKNEQLREKFSQLTKANRDAGEVALAVTEQPGLLSLRLVGQPEPMAYQLAELNPDAGEITLAVTEQLDLLSNRLANQPEPEIYYSQAQSLSNLFSIVDQALFSPFDYLGEAISRVTRPVRDLVNQELDLLGQALDDASGQRLSTLHQFLVEQVEAFSDTAETYLNLAPDHSAQALHQAAQAAAERGLSADGLDAMQQISLEQRANLPDPGQERDLTALLEAGGYTLLAQLTGYVRTLADDSLQWLDESMSALESFLALPDQQTIDETRRQLEQMQALQADGQRSESELHYLAGLLGVDLDAWLHGIGQTGSAWLEELDNLADHLIDFVGPDGIQIVQGINAVISVPLSVIEYPLERLSAAAESISRYTAVQGDRMTLQILLALEEIEQQLAAAGQNLSRWQDLPGELYTCLNDFFSSEQAAAVATEIYQQALGDTWQEWLESWGDGGQTHNLAEWIIQMTGWIQRLNLDLPAVTASITPTDELTTEEPVETSDQDTDGTSDPGEPDPTSDPDLSEDMTGDSWSGQWSGVMQVKDIYQPDEYSDEETELLLSTPIPISFVIGRYEEGGFYIVDMEGEKYDLVIDQQEMTVIFRASLPDQSAVLYQAISGRLAADGQTISGHFTLGIEGYGDYLGGTWSASRDP